MSDKNKINIKLELSKDEYNNKLNVIVHFNENSSNFNVSKNTCYWKPTLDEVDLINEAVKLVSNKNLNLSQSPSVKTHVEEKTEENTNYKPKEEVEDNLDDETPVEETVEPSVVVNASDDMLEETIQKHIKNDEDDDLKQADEHTIIDRVLTQKKKGRWKKIE